MFQRATQLNMFLGVDNPKASMMKLLASSLQQLLVLRLQPSSKKSWRYSAKSVNKIVSSSLDSVIGCGGVGDGVAVQSFEETVMSLLSSSVGDRLLEDGVVSTEDNDAEPTEMVRSKQPRQIVVVNERSRQMQFWEFLMRSQL